MESMANRTSRLKEDVLRTSKTAYREGLFAGTSGNLSAFDPESGHIVITPTSLPYETMQVEDLVVLGLDGNVIEGQHQPSSEWRMHCEIYKQRKDVLAVVHTHSPYATAFAVTGEKVPLILIEMIPFIGGDIPVAEFGLPGSMEIGVEALKVLGHRNACLLSNHGVLAIGTSLEQAHIRVVYVEDAAKIYHHALVAAAASLKTGGRTSGVRLMPEDAVRKMRERYGLPEEVE